MNPKDPLDYGFLFLFFCMGALCLATAARMSGCVDSQANYGYRASR